MNSGNRTVLGIILLVVVFFVVLMVFASFTIKSLDSASDGMMLNKDSNKLAVVEIEGVILDSKKTVEKLLKAEKAKSKGIILRINSPGGAVGPVQEIYNEVIRIDKDIPVLASFGSVAASGGYYIGAAAREIYSNPGTLTGSIGVIMEFTNLEELFKFVKVKPQTLKAGRYKDIGSPNREMTPEERQMMLDTLNDTRTQFVGDILIKRKEKIKGDIQEMAQGQVFSGAQALEFGLVDKLGSMWQAGRDLAKTLKIEGEPQYWYITDKKENRFWELLEGLDEASSHLNFLKAPIEGMKHLLYMGQNRQPFYLYQ